MLQDTILSTAQWNFDPASAELHITSSGKKYDYMVRDLMDRYLVLSLKEKPDSLITMNEYTSSLQRLENRMSDNRARRRKYEQQSKQSTSSQKNKKGKFSKQGDAAPETITRQRDVGTVTEDVVVEDQNPIPPTTSDELISTWKAIEISSADYENSKAKMELKNETLLTFNKDNTFTLKNGNNTIKGKWKCNKYLRTMYLEVDGQERYCPLTLTSGFYGKDHLTNTDKQLTLILALPGEKEVMKVKFQQVPGK